MASRKKDKGKQGSGYISHGRVAENRRARHEYEIGDTFEAGLVLTGSEVKSLRLGRANLLEAYAAEKGGELFLLGAEIGDWQAGHPFAHQARRPRKLLLHRKEISRLIGAIKQKGFTLVPLKLYFNEQGRAKLLLGLGKGRKQYEKREVAKDRDWQRQKERVLKDKW